jgi:hypothetical protein
MKHDGGLSAAKTLSWVPFKGNNPKMFRRFCGN